MSQLVGLSIRRAVMARVDKAREEYQDAEQAYVLAFESSEDNFAECGRCSLRLRAASKALREAKAEAQEYGVNPNA